eukprot:gene1102-2651_t
MFTDPRKPCHCEVCLSIWFARPSPALGDAYQFTMLNARSVGAQFGMPKKEKKLPLKDEAKYIQCDVCKEVVNRLYKSAKALDKMQEEAILEAAEKTCDLGSDEGAFLVVLARQLDSPPPYSWPGEWVSRYDIVQLDGKLVLEEQDTFGECNRECETIREVCDDILGEYDTDLSEALYKSKGQSRATAATRSKVENAVCYDSDLCRKGSNKVPKKKVRITRPRTPGDVPPARTRALIG